MNPLTTIKGTIIAGAILAVIVAVGAGLAGDGIGPLNELSLIIWLHVLAGITWIGLLYYFNFVQMPALAAAAKDQGGPGGAGIGKYVAPLALLWFRWAALATWLTGVAYLLRSGMFGAAFTLQGSGLNIGIGAWLGTIMMLNVWVFIWPNQKKVLGLVEATADQIAKARKVATLASRTNVMLSIPMLMSMAGPFAHTHAGFFL